MSNANWRHFDFWLLGAVAILTIIGVAMINSTIAGNIDVANNAQRQLTFAVIGFVFVFIVAAIDYHLWSSVSTTVYWATFAMLVVLNVVAAAVFGSARWFKTALVNIQPSELAKIVLILTVSNYFARNMKNMHQFRYAFNSLLMAFGLVIWVLIQPNMSTSILMMVIWFALWWASGMYFKHFLAFVGIGIALILVIIPLFPVLQEAKVINDYQIKRIQTFLAPEAEGGTYGDTYNIQQAQISIGSGGLLGQGWSRPSGAATFPEGALVRFYFFGDGSRIWICWFAGDDGPAVVHRVSLSACGPQSRRHLWWADLLWRGNPVGFSGDG